MNNLQKTNQLNKFHVINTPFVSTFFKLQHEKTCVKTKYNVEFLNPQKYLLAGSDFTMKLLEPGKAFIILPSGLKIDTVKIVTSATGYLEQQYVETLNYQIKDIFYYESQMWPANTEISIVITWKSNAPTASLLFNLDTDDYGEFFAPSSIYCNAKYEVYGNLLSLYRNAPANTQYYNFSNLFCINTLSCESIDELSLEYPVSNQTGETGNKYLVNAYYLIIPRNSNCDSMFKNCINLQYAPCSIDFTQYVNFYSMFDGCVNLRIAPSFHYYDTQSINGIFMNAFRDCEKLEYAEFYGCKFSASSATNYNCISNTNMFSGCSNLKEIYCNSYNTSNEQALRTQLGISSTCIISTMNTVNEKPTIYVDSNQSSAHGAASLQAAVQNYDTYSKKFIYVGEVWFNNRSYYYWRYNYNQSGGDSGIEQHAEYILTDTGDFSGMSLYDNINNRNDVVAYTLNEDCEMVYEHGQWSKVNIIPNEKLEQYAEDEQEYYSVVTNCKGLLWYWNGVKPSTVAGTPKIWLEDNLSLFFNQDLLYDLDYIDEIDTNAEPPHFNIFEYKHHCDCYEYIKKINNNFLWKHTQQNLWIVTNTLDFSGCTFIENLGDASACLASTCGVLYTSNDEGTTQYYPGSKYYIIAWNQICPENCDLQL